ncbi:hypothetical protein [Actinophytocola glycyrrhizae]|uniref:Uncharacterized protein n=1 Tax=Actinophytocola glycyrrhizae TaxID=2044873 RepID=A0ABV9S3J1_9PSEU
MNHPVDPDRTRLDLNPADPPPAVAEPVAAEEVADADHSRRRAVNVVCTIINAVCAIFAVVLALHIVLVIGEANQGNGFAALINDWSGAVSLGLRDLFVPENLKLRTFLNDGLAAIAWLAIAGLLTYLIRRLALPGPRRTQRRYLVR